MPGSTFSNRCFSTGTLSTESNPNFEFTAVPYTGDAFLSDILPSLPKGSAVYKVFDTRGQLIVLDRTSNLFQRLERYFGPRCERVRDLDLRKIASRIEYRRTWSSFETTYVLYVQRREIFPKTYRKMRTFRLFMLMKLNRRQRFPRVYASRQIKAGVEYFGPFVSRAQFNRLKTAMERTFRLRPCLYNIRGNDPHSDCLYFQMHTCSRPCNNDITREDYLADVDAAAAFIEGNDERLQGSLLAEINRLAGDEKFEEAETLKRRLEKIQRARKEIRESFPSVWEFHCLLLLPSDSTARTKVAFVRAGSIVAFGDYDTGSLADALPGEVSRRLSGPLPHVNREWQYDEFCLVAHYLLHPLKTVDLVRVGEGMNLQDYLRKRQPRQRKREPDST